jgi:cbb3-type cytochrome oxidase subunit 3
MSTFLRQLYTDTPLTIAGLLIFFTLFLLVCAWVFLRTGAKQQYEAIARFPLREDGESYERR